MLRLQNVATRRRDRINSDEEERTRLGYEVRTVMRFKEISGQPQFQTASVGQQNAGPRLHTAIRGCCNNMASEFGLETFAKTASNLVLCSTSKKGYWQKSDELPPDDDVNDLLGPRTERVVPFVDDRRNCLIVTPVEGKLPNVMASLQAALKKAIEAV